MYDGSGCGASCGRAFGASGGCSSGGQTATESAEPLLMSMPSPLDSYSGNFGLGPPCPAVMSPMLVR